MARRLVAYGRVRDDYDILEMRDAKWTSVYVQMKPEDEAIGSGERRYVGTPARPTLSIALSVIEAGYPFYNPPKEAPHGD